MGGETWPGRSSEPGGVCTTLADAGDVTVMRVQGEVDLATVLIVRTTFGRALGAGPAESRCGCVRHDVLRSARSGGPHERCDRGCRAGNPLRGQWALTVSCADMRDGVDRNSEPRGAHTRTRSPVSVVTVTWVRGEVDVSTVAIVRTTFGRTRGPGWADSRRGCARHDVLRGVRSDGPCHPDRSDPSRPRRGRLCNPGRGSRVDSGDARLGSDA
jgi:hypothetical protein